MATDGWRGLLKEEILDYDASLHEEQSEMESEKSCHVRKVWKRLRLLTVRVEILSFNVSFLSSELKSVKKSRNFTHIRSFQILIHLM